MIDAGVLKALLAPGEPALSVYFPVDPAQADMRDPASRLRALVARAEQALIEHGVGEESASETVGTLIEIADGMDLEHHRDLGFAYFASPRTSHVVTLPALLAEAVVVAEGFHIKPLLPLAARNLRFNVLALSAGDARLYAATPYDWNELALDILPGALDGEFGEDGGHAVTASGAADAAGDPHNAMLMEDMRRVAHAVRHALSGDTAPLLLAAEPHIAGHFRKVAKLPTLFHEALILNPFAFDPRQLHAKATAVLGPLLDAEPEAVLEQVRARLGSAEPTVGIRLEEILARAREGRVEALIVAEDQALYSRPSGAGGKMEPHFHQADAEPDLLNEAVLEALRHGGRAFAMPIGRLPRGVPAVATYRY